MARMKVVEALPLASMLRVYGWHTPTIDDIRDMSKPLEYNCACGAIFHRQDDAWFHEQKHRKNRSNEQHNRAEGIYKAWKEKNRTI